MKYLVKVAGHEYEIVIEGENIFVDGDPVMAQLLKDSGPGGVLLIDGSVVNLSFDDLADGWVVDRSGESVEVTVETERDRLLKRFGPGLRAGGRDGVVKAPMPGLVLRMLAAEGDRVEKGQGLIVLEAMKMENEIKSPVAGVVGPSMVELGVAVEKGTPLLEVFPEG